MTFTTLTFFLFLPIVFAVHWLLRSHRAQNSLLVLASYIFYGWWDYRFCGLMLLSSLIDFVGSWAIAGTESASRRKRWLIACLSCNLVLLGVFKYYNFFAESLRDLATQVGWHFDTATLSIALPVGISFYTFQTMSYSINVYQRKLAPTYDLIEFLAFVSFFPQLVAGPIERATDLLPQFTRARRFDFAEAPSGCRLILWGLFKKLVLADRLALMVDPSFDNYQQCSRAQLILATFGFAWQIYCDFSAYSDIAIGTAKLFGVKLSRNFAYPYFSQSVAEFWRRWHISLSTWFRDNVYIPLGGSRGQAWRRYANVLLTFLISGLWHGAAWRFLVWGGIHGAATIGSQASSLAKPPRSQDVPGGPHLLPKPLAVMNIAATFGLVCLGWIFFRAGNVSIAAKIVVATLNGLLSPSTYLEMIATIRSDVFMQATMWLLAAFVMIEWLQRRQACPLDLPRIPRVMRWTAYTLLLWGTLLWMPSSESRPFIYFAF